MERIDRELLNNALTTPDAHLQQRLKSEGFLALGILLEKTLRRYPSQENAETIDEYLADFEQLALKYSLLKVEEVLGRLRIDPDQEFFPKPNEVAREIEQHRLKSLPSHIYAQG